RREVVFGLAVLVDALVFGDDTGDAVALVNEFGTAKFLEDVDASGFDKAAEPFGDSAQRDNIVPLVLKRWRRDGKTQGGTFCEKQCGGIRDRRIQRRGLLKIGNELSKRFGDHDRAGKRSEEHTSELQSLAYLVC